MIYLEMIRNIINGWVLFYFPTKEALKLGEERMIVCRNCTSNVKDKCIECGCPLPKKVLVKESDCDLGKW